MQTENGIPAALLSSAEARYTWDQMQAVMVAEGDAAPEDWPLADSTPIARLLNQRYPDRIFIPATPVQGVGVPDLYLAPPLAEIPALAGNKDTFPNPVGIGVPDDA